MTTKTFSLERDFTESNIVLLKLERPISKVDFPKFNLPEVDAFKDSKTEFILTGREKVRIIKLAMLLYYIVRAHLFLANVKPPISMKKPLKI